MLRIKIELVPFGIEEGSKQIGEMIIGNINTNDKNEASYIYAYKDDHSAEEYGQIHGFQRNLGVWELIAQCLKSDEETSEEYKDILHKRFS